MSNRYWDQFQFTMERRVINLYAQVSFGASGAPTLGSWQIASRSYTAAPTTGSSPAQVGARGVKTIVRTAPGTYTITLQDNYFRFLGCSPSFQNSGAAAAPLTITPSPDANLSTAGGGSFQLIFLNTAGTATDPANGEKVILNIQLQDSSTP